VIGLQMGGVKNHFCKWGVSQKPFRFRPVGLKSEPSMMKVRFYCRFLLPRLLALRPLPVLSTPPNRFASRASSLRPAGSIRVRYRFSPPRRLDPRPLPVLSAPPALSASAAGSLRPACSIRVPCRFSPPRLLDSLPQMLTPASDRPLNPRQQPGFGRSRLRWRIQLPVPRLLLGAPPPAPDPSRPRPALRLAKR
jgi:hypothetical protein